MLLLFSPNQLRVKVNCRRNLAELDLELELDIADCRRLIYCLLNFDFYKLRCMLSLGLDLEMSINASNAIRKHESL